MTANPEFAFGGGRRGSLGRIATTLVTLVLLTSSFVVGLAEAVVVSSGTLGGFENDGNFIVNSTGNLDWAVVTPAIVPDDTADSGFTEGSKELKPSEWICGTGGANPNKANLIRAYVNGRVDFTSAYVDLAWVREGVAGGGDVHLNFEFNQTGTSAPGPFVPGDCPITRIADDILVTYDFPGGNNPPDIKLFKWQPLVTPTTSADGAWIDLGLPASAARGAVNQVAVTDPIAELSVDELRFGEATIDLLAVLSPGAVGGCLNFGSANIRSRSSGESITSALQDKMPSTPIDLSTCKPTTTTTTSSPTGGNVVPGTSVQDVATVVSALTGDQGTPTGTVKFFLCQPNEVASGGCVSGGTQIGSAVALSGGQATSASTTNTTTIGKYCWRAEYSGDANYAESSHTNSTTECFTTVKQPSTTGTTSSPTGGNVVPGTSASDTATVSGSGPTPTGTVAFFLCQPNEVTSGGCPSGGTQIGGVVTLAAGSATSSSSTNTTTIGTYCWRAEYSGDGFYLSSSHTNATSECFTTVKQPSSTATTSSPTGGEIVPGTSATDTATVTGSGPTPTGTVTFFLCGPAQTSSGGCVSGGTQVGSAVALVAGSATSASTTSTLQIGKYCWRAEYSGDGFYLSSSHTNATSECFTTVTQPSAVTTLSSPQGGQVVPGTSASDTATVNGLQALGTPTGTATFFLCQPSEVTVDVGCDEGDGTQVGSAVSLVSGTATSASTSNTTSIGTYCWRAEYSGDALYNPSSHTNFGSECFTTVKQPSDTATTASPTAETVLPRTATSDTAVVSGGQGQPTPTGTVTFFLCGPTEVTDEVGCEDGGTQVGAPVTLVEGTALSADTSATAAVGTFCWRAEYSGDGFYLPSEHTNFDTECFATDVDPAIEILKDGANVAHEGDTVEYTFLVTNVGDVVLHDVVVTDDVLGEIGTIDVLDIGPENAVELTKEFVVPADTDTVSNTATACGTDEFAAKDEVCDEDPHAMVIIHPSVDIVKTADPADGGPRLVTYTYVVTNTGDTALFGIEVTDDILGLIGTIPTLEPGDSATLTTTVAVDGGTPPTNVGTACGDDVLGLEVCDADDETITVVLGTTIVLPRTGLGAHLQVFLSGLLLWIGAASMTVHARFVGRRRRRTL